MQPAAVRQRRVDERRRQINPPARGLQHPLDQISHLIGPQDRRGQLAATAARDKDPTRCVNPDLLYPAVIKKRLQRTEARDRVVHLAGDLLRIGQARQRTTQRSVVIVGDHVIDQPADLADITRRIQPATAHQLAHLLLNNPNSIHALTFISTHANKPLVAPQAAHAMSRMNPDQCRISRLWITLIREPTAGDNLVEPSSSTWRTSKVGQTANMG
jgi:hypothetical protein